MSGTAVHRAGVTTCTFAGAPGIGADGGDDLFAVGRCCHCIHCDAL